MKLKVNEVSYHRNGVCGEGFYACLFTDLEQRGKEGKPGLMLGIVFDGPGQCAVIQLNQDLDMTVAFGVNSWRGDHYEPLLRNAIKSMKSSGSVRVGPFSIPTGKATP